MKKLIAALVLLATPAFAADMPTKAPPFKAASIFDGYSGAGPYVGIYTQGGGGSVNGAVPGVGSASLTTTSASVGLLAGYAWSGPSNNYFFAVEGMFGWQNFNGNQAGLSLSGPASFEQRFKLGAPLPTIMALLPNLNFGTVAPLPALPAGVTATNVHPYLMAGIHEDDISANFMMANNRAWRVAPSVGFGAVTQLSNATAVDVWIETIFPEKGVCTGPTDVQVGCTNLGQQVKAGISVLW